MRLQRIYENRDQNKVVVCDSCVCNWRISFHEYTGSLDFAVYGQTIFIPTKIHKALLEIYKNDSTLFYPINVTDYLFSYAGNFAKLWPDSTRYTSSWNDYQVTGHVREFKYTTHSRPGEAIQLYFCLDDYREIKGSWLEAAEKSGKNQ